jgi:hypothetical protein
LEKGKKRKKVALLSPFSDQNQKPRRLGPLAHRGKLSFKDWEIDSATLLEGK